MRSPIGPVLVVLGLATTLVLVLLLLQVSGLRSDLEAARADVTALQSQVDSREPGVTATELQQELDTLRADLVDALGSAGGADGDPTQPAGGGSPSELLDMLDEVLDRITALDRRVSDICESVPVC
jgi:hypothetical protein